MEENIMHPTLKHYVDRAVFKIADRIFPAETVAEMRHKHGWELWIDTLTPDLLEDLTDAPQDIKQRLFKQNVSLVEIETHAKCNRVCSFCPNAIVDRRRNQTLADAAMLDRVFDELGQINFTGQIKIARYSEPLANKDYLYQRLASAHQRVPTAQLMIVTNTDYLKREMLAELREVGLKILNMSIYLRPGEHWSLEYANQYNDKLAEKLGIPIISRRETPNSVRCVFEYSGIQIHSSCMDFDNYGTDRGAVMEQYTSALRLGPCREPFSTFVIDYNGSVMPCCNLRSDIDSHKQAVVADLSVPGTSIFDIYAGRLAGWRRSMVGFEVKGSPCTTCLHRDMSASMVPALAARMEKHMNRAGMSQYYHPPAPQSVIPLTQIGSD
ncbi:MAG: hypothetical protein K8J31_24245 [Anaerolineae bacterium]|nr:hypothetical protein [Anaerolineae bacterium]